MSKSTANKKKPQPEPSSLKKNQKAPGEPSSPKKQPDTSLSQSKLQPKPEEQLKPEPELLQKSQRQADPQLNSSVSPEPVHDQQEQESPVLKKSQQVDNNHHVQNSSPPPEEESDEVPADKDKLVAYLKNKLLKAEMTMSTLFVAIQIERDKREKLVKEITDKKEELEQVNSYEDTFLGEKVQDKMTTALKRALEDKVLADQEIAGADNVVDELEKEIQDLDLKIRDVHKGKYQKEIDADEAQYKVNEQESVVDNFNEELGKLKTLNEDKDRTIAELNDEINDMKGVVEMLITARTKLNYYVSDDTPSHSRENTRNIATPQEGGFTDMMTRGGQNYVSEEMERGLGRTEKPRLQQKDDDFWYADPTMKKGVTEVKRGGYNDPIPWQPKVQNYDSLNDRDRGLMTRTPEYNSGLSSVRLPSLGNVNPNLKGEHLYKNKEYIDELGGQKNQKKNQNQYKKR